MLLIFTSGGAKLVSLNEKQRGFPKGLRVLASLKYDYCLLEIKPSLDEVRLKEAEWMHIKSIEVWGCGGAQARETQLRMKEWDAREALRRREVGYYTCLLSTIIAIGR